MNLKSIGVLAPRLQKRWDAYAADNRGQAAVEFALIAVPFFFFIFGLLEVCVIFIMSTVLEHSIQEASRGIRTGQAQNGGQTEEQFRTAVCSRLMDLLNCDSKLHVDVKQFNEFSSTRSLDPIDPDTKEFKSSSVSYDPGGPNEIVMVRVFYEWDLITPVMSKPLNNIAGNKHLLQANMVFRNEPYTEELEEAEDD